MKVLQNNRRFMTTQLRDRVFTISGGVDIVAFETPFKLLEQTGIVFNDEKFASLLCHELFCRNAPKRLMCNGATKRVLFAVEGSQARMWTSANRSGHWPRKPDHRACRGQWPLPHPIYLGI